MAAFQRKASRWQIRYFHSLAFTVTSLLWSQHTTSFPGYRYASTTPFTTVLFVLALLSDLLRHHRRRTTNRHFYLEFDHRSPWSEWSVFYFSLFPYKVEPFADFSYQMADESFEVHVPKQYSDNAQENWGLLVYTNSSPGGQAKLFKSDVLAQKRLDWRDQRAQQTGCFVPLGH